LDIKPDQPLGPAHHQHEQRATWANRECGRQHSVAEIGCRREDGPGFGTAQEGT
jgi:hypothetical protein